MTGTVITGTGRAGTSFLVAVLSELGLPTGFTAAQAGAALLTPWHAGLEHRPSACRCNGGMALCLEFRQGLQITKAPQLAQQEQHD